MKLSLKTENQNIEFKTIWKDDFLKHITAFANSKGGILFIGLDDHGNITGLTDSKRLLEEIPNKAIQYLGVIVDINLHTESNLNYLSIDVKQSPTPISYKGKYYIRSGSTVQELRGTELQYFILKKLGKSFDELPVISATIDDIDVESVKKFMTKAVKSNRITIDAQKDDIHSVLLNLKLIDENSQLKNAAILLFGKNPSAFFSSVSFRIGRFGSDHHDLKFQDVIEGNIFEMPEKVLNTLKSKYLTMPIRYEGLQRIEELEYPEEALREAILNAVIHKDYTGVHIQLSVYDNKMILWNPGKIPNEISWEQLKDKHPSIPRNKLIADIFFKAGYIEAWGRGINKIISKFAEASLPEPLFEDLAGGVQLTFSKDLIKDLIKDLSEDLSEDLNIQQLTANQMSILREIEKNKNITQAELAQRIGINEKNIRNNIKKSKN